MKRLHALATSGGSPEVINNRSRSRNGSGVWPFFLGDGVKILPEDRSRSGSRTL